MEYEISLEWRPLAIKAEDQGNGLPAGVEEFGYYAIVRRSLGALVFRWMIELEFDSLSLSHVLREILHGRLTHR